MQSFAALPDEDRWALAFHSGRLAFADAEKGERLWNEDESIPPESFPTWRHSTAITPADLARQIGDEKAFAVIA
jgi:high-affinity iron transporter